MKEHLSKLDDSKKAVLRTYGITCFDDIVDFDEAQSLIKFANGDERRTCDVYTRVMGYHRPVSCANHGKRQEHRDRRYFKEATLQL